MAFGKTKDVAIKFVNATGQTVSIAREGHRVKNPGLGGDGWGDLVLGVSINVLPNGGSRTVVQDLNVNSDDDIQFEMIKRQHARNTIYPYNKSAIDDLTVNDTLNLTTVRSAQSMLNSNQAEPFSMVKVPSNSTIASDGGAPGAAPGVTTSG